MRAPTPTPDKLRSGQHKVGKTYRGVRVPTTLGPTRFTRDEIERAVDAAFQKNADALARKS